MCISQLWAAPGELRGNPPLFLITACAEKKIWICFDEIMSARWLFCFTALQQREYSTFYALISSEWPFLFSPLQSFWGRPELPRLLPAFPWESLSHTEGHRDWSHMHISTSQSLQHQRKYSHSFLPDEEDICLPTDSSNVTCVAIGSISNFILFMLWNRKGSLKFTGMWRSIFCQTSNNLHLETIGRWTSLYCNCCVNISLHWFPKREQHFKFPYHKNRSKIITMKYKTHVTHPVE